MIIVKNVTQKYSNKQNKPFFIGNNFIHSFCKDPNRNGIWTQNKKNEYDANLIDKEFNFSLKIIILDNFKINKQLTNSINTYEFLETKYVKINNIRKIGNKYNIFILSTKENKSKSYIAQ